MSCLLFHAASAATACREYLVSSGRGSELATVEPQAIAIRVLECDVEVSGVWEPVSSEEQNRYSTICIHAIFFPLEALPLAMSFWRLTGLGLSSRRAEICRLHLDSIREVAPRIVPSLQNGRPSKGRSHAQEIVSQRIANLLERCPVGGTRRIQVSRDDVYLYQSGMAAIYHLYQLLLRSKGSQSVIFGFPYELTLKMLETYGPQPPVFYGLGDDHELDRLEIFVESLAAEGKSVRSIWCECPSNPLLRVPDLLRLRKLADYYGFVLVVDETIGTFGNLDLLGVADVVLTSLTKTFSGYADVMGGRYGYFAPLQCQRSVRH